MASADILIPVDKQESEEQAVNSNIHPKSSTPKADKEVNYPYKYEIELLLSIIASFAVVYCGYLFIFYGGYRLPQPLDYMEPCNATNLTTIKNFNGMKAENKKLEEEMNAITIVAAYDISAPYKSSLLDKNATLANASAKLTKQLDYQRTLRYECYKTNLYSPCCRIQHLIFYSYCAVISVLNILSVFYDQRSGKCHLTFEQQYARQSAQILIFLSCVAHFIIMIVFQVKQYYNPCEVYQGYLDQFSL